MSWNSMIFWCVKVWFMKGALELFEGMKRDGFELDEMTVVSVLRAVWGYWEFGLREGG